MGPKLYGTSVVSDNNISIPIGTGENQHLSSEHTKKESDADNGSSGSSATEATFNFMSSLIGAGVIGFGGAIAKSGGLISLVSILLIAYMSKLALDMVVMLAVEETSSSSSLSSFEISSETSSETSSSKNSSKRNVEHGESVGFTEAGAGAGAGADASFEGLATVAYGLNGRRAVIISKLFFTFGCLVALIKITQDNIAPAINNLMYYYYDDNESDQRDSGNDNNEKFMTVIACTVTMLPLSMLRDVSALANFSGIKIVTFAFIVLISIYVQIRKFDSNDYVGKENLFNHWLEIKGGFVESLGTFVFGYVAQHTVHLVFLSLKPEVRNVKEWRKISTVAVSISTLISISLAMSVYMTFWENTSSSMFDKYKQSSIPINIARILLSISSMLTYPLCFVSCREMIIISLPSRCSGDDNGNNSHGHPDIIDVDDEKMLLLKDNKGSTSNDTSNNNKEWLVPGTENQLIQSYHVLLSIFLYSISLYLAINATSLVDVLNLVGCATGTVLAFILPSLFYFKLRGFNAFFPIFLFIVGGTIGVVGTWNCLLGIFYKVK